MLLNNPLHLRNLLRRLLCPHRLLTAADVNDVEERQEPGRVLVARPPRHVRNDVLRESVADDAAAFVPVSEAPCVADLLIVAAVGKFEVGEDAARGEDEDEEELREELHF